MSVVKESVNDSKIYLYDIIPHALFNEAGIFFTDISIQEGKWVDKISLIFRGTVI